MGITELRKVRCYDPIEVHQRIHLCRRLREAQEDRNDWPVERVREMALTGLVADFLVKSCVGASFFRVDVLTPVKSSEEQSGLRRLAVQHLKLKVHHPTPQWVVKWVTTYVGGCIFLRAQKPGVVQRIHLLKWGADSVHVPS